MNSCVESAPSVWCRVETNLWSKESGRVRNNGWSKLLAYFITIQCIPMCPSSVMSAVGHQQPDKSHSYDRTKLVAHVRNTSQISMPFESYKKSYIPRMKGRNHMKCNALGQAEDRTVLFSAVHSVLSQLSGKNSRTCVVFGFKSVSLFRNHYFHIIFNFRLKPVLSYNQTVVQV